MATDRGTYWIYIFAPEQYPIVMWLQMRRADLPRVNTLADMIHISYPEDAEVFKERLALFPSGCFILKTDDDACIGYAITHPWLFGRPPPLNSLLGSIPQNADTYYIHDIALIEIARSHHHGTTIIAMLTAFARDTGFHTITLVAVNNSTSFWESQGFRAVSGSGLAEKLKTYDDNAMYMCCDL